MWRGSVTEFPVFLFLVFLISAVAYSDLLFFYVISEHWRTLEIDGFTRMHDYVETFYLGQAGEGAGAVQSRMLGVWAYHATWKAFSSLISNDAHAIRLAALTVQSLAAGLYAVGAFLFVRVMVRDVMLSVFGAAIIVQALLATQFSYPFAGALREGFFLLGVAMVLAGHWRDEGPRLSDLAGWTAFFALAASARYDVAMLVALIGFLISVSVRRYPTAALHVGGAVLATLIYQAIRWHVGATDTIGENFHDSTALGQELRILVALKNAAFYISLLLLFNVGIVALIFWRSLGTLYLIVLGATGLYSVFLVFVGSYVEPRLWIPLAAVLLAGVFKLIAARGREEGYLSE
jgi:hypothetical protein